MFKNPNSPPTSKKKIAIIGSGIGSLSVASLLARDGYSVTILEQNYLPGGCVSSYFRKGFIFESGATTLVGLDENMPLGYLARQLNINIQAIPLQKPMQVYLADGRRLERHQALEDWIREAERVFGSEGQRPFWETCYRISQSVWKIARQQRNFPPSRWRDLWAILRNFRFDQLRQLPLSFRSTDWLLKKHGLAENPIFVDFVNEQLLITAQNYADQVNLLFGATALCYTNYGNYYMPAGLIQLSRQLCEYIEARGGKILLRTAAQKINYQNQQYQIQTPDQTFVADYLISGIPINNTLELFESPHLHRKYKKRLLDSAQLYSAFQMGIGFRQEKQIDCLHHQIHLAAPLPIIGAQSIFLSFSHPQDIFRAARGQMVASVSAHIPNPKQFVQIDKTKIEKAILEILEQRNLIYPRQIIYQHSSAASAWERWTGRKYGFVGGYPQLLKTKPWQMLDARLDGYRAYICGDTTYPGQGIPGACLSGIITYEKMLVDGLGRKK